MSPGEFEAAWSRKYWFSAFLSLTAFACMICMVGTGRPQFVLFFKKAGPGGSLLHMPQGSCIDVLCDSPLRLPSCRRQGCGDLWIRAVLRPPASLGELQVAAACYILCSDLALACQEHQAETAGHNLQLEWMEGE